MGSFGDHRLKELVTCEPYINTHRLKWEEDLGDKNNNSGFQSFLIIACDGLWDVFTDEEACGMVNHFLHNISSKNRPCSSQISNFEEGADDDDDYNWKDQSNNPDNENDIIDEYYKETSTLKDRQNVCAKILVQEAMRRGSTDNITCVVAFL